MKFWSEICGVGLIALGVSLLVAGCETFRRNQAAYVAHKALSGDLESVNRLGVYFMKGYGVEKDPAKAAALYRVAAERGNTLAKVNLGVLLVNGQGVESNAIEAVEWFKEAAAEGEIKAYYPLPNMLCGFIHSGTTGPVCGFSDTCKSSIRINLQQSPVIFNTLNQPYFHLFNFHISI